MANARLIPANWFDEAQSLTATSEASSSLAIAKAQVPTRGTYWRSTSTAAQTIQGQWGGSIRKTNCLAIFRHNLHGGTVRLQLYSDAAWTTQVYDSTALTVSTTPAGTYDWGNTTGVDPLLYEAPYVLWFTESTTAKSFRITLGGSPASGASYWQIGRIWLGRYFEVGANPAPGLDVGWSHAAEMTRTRGGSLRVSPSERWRRMSMEFAAMSENDRQTWLDVQASSGQKDIVLSVFAALTGRLERDYTINARFVANPIAYHYGFKQMRVTLEEC